MRLGRQGKEYVQHLGTLHDRAEGTGTHAAAAACALVEIDFCPTVRPLVHGLHGTGCLAGHAQVHNGLVGAVVVAHAAVAACGGINVGSAACNGDGAKMAGRDTGAGHTALAGIAHKVACLGTAVAGNVADREERPVGRMCLDGFLCKVL